MDRTRANRNIHAGLWALGIAMFLFALTFVLDNNERTVPVSISLISGASKYDIPWGKVMAASVLVTLPLIGLVLVFQKKIVSGLTAGAVKG